MAKVLERSLYKEDYYAWTKQQAAELRRLAATRSKSTLDLENLAEEVESLGQGDLSTVRSQVRRIIEHLLKLEYSPATDPRPQWRRSVNEARDEVADHLTAALRRDLEPDVATQLDRGRRNAELAMIEHGEREAAKAFPRTCPYDLDQIVGHDWYPANRHRFVDDIPGDG
ncbi:MAG TPA: DUF29 domain-containing protein [Geminicoccaceae bacterium]|nr:DUF29 domain-containing protein [Geminicoccaceae bacterium]